MSTDATPTGTPDLTSLGSRGRHLVGLASPVIHEAVSRGRTDRHCCDGTGSVCRRTAGELATRGLLGDAEALAGAQAEVERLRKEVAAARREGAVQALREAAADDETGWALRTWLNERADAIEAGEDQP